VAQRLKLIKLKIDLICPTSLSFEVGREVYQEIPGTIQKCAGRFPVRFKSVPGDSRYDSKVYRESPVFKKIKYGNQPLKLQILTLTGADCHP
jgi:hypothetical protein